MRLFMRVLLAFVTSVVLIVIFMPFMIGVFLQRSGHIAFSNESNYFDVEVVKYDRHWFTSDVIFKIKGKPELIAKLQTLSMQTTAPIPPNLEFVIKGHLQHGPIFYSPSPNSPPVGLALMTRQLVLTKEQRPFFNRLGNENIIKNNTSYLSFTGKYQDFLEIENFQLVTADGVRFELNNLQTRIWSSPNTIQGEIKLRDFTVGDSNTTINVPSLQVQLDLQKKNGLWLGNQTLFVSQIEMIDADQQVRLSGIELTGGLHEKAGSISGDKDLSINSLAFNDQVIGPVQLTLGIKKLNAKVISDLVDTYQYINQHGEMYESQLKEKILALLPGVIGPDSSLSLNKLSVKTPNGALMMDAKVYWPADHFSAMDSIQEVAESASVKAGFNVSIPLAKQIVNLLAKLTYTYQIPYEERQNLLELQNRIHLVTQLNAYGIVDLIGTGAIPKDEGIDLLTKIHNNISLTDYLEEVKKLLLLRKIDLATSYELNFLYTLLNQQYNEFDHRIDMQQKQAEKLIQNQLNQYLTDGLIIQEDNQYKMSVTRDTGHKVIVNGKPLSVH